MSKKFYDRLLTGTGVSGQQVESEFGSKILSKLGWKPGEGLGAERKGMTECIQISRREEAAGLGKEKDKSSEEWGDWWTASFNLIAQQIQNKNNKLGKKRSRSPVSSEDDSSSSSDESSSSSSSSSSGPRYSAIKKAGVQRGKLGRVARQDAAYKK
jgi:Pin2-interacting protein X1